MKKKILSIVMTIVIVSLMFGQSYADEAYDALLKTIRENDALLEKSKKEEDKKYQDLVDYMKNLNSDIIKSKEELRQQYEQLLAFVDELNAKLAEDLEYQKAIYKDLMLSKEEFHANIYKVPFSFDTIDSDASDDLKQLIENIKNGLLDYAKVTVDDGFIRYTFFNKTNVKINGKDYLVSEITVYNDNYDIKSFERDLSSMDKSFRTKSELSSPIPSDMKITLNPVNSADGEQITKDLKIKMNWDKAGKLHLIRPKDMTESDWAYVPAVHNMTIGNFSGNEKGDFMPKMIITRGQFATVLGRIAEVDINSYTKPVYNDVSSDKYYAPYTTWAKENDLFYLEDINKFLPEKELTREEMAYILYQYIKTKGIELEDVAFDGFSDEAEISDWAKEAVMFLAKKGVIKGYDGKFDPQATFTREQVAQILYSLREFI